MQVLNAIIYKLNAADQEALTTAQGNASTQAQTIVSDYQGTFGQITAQDMADAKVKTKQDYVISYIMGTQWSGTDAAQKPPVTYSEMASARNLKRLMPAAPASADQVIADVTVYLNIMSPVNGLSDQLQNGQWIIASLKNNTMYPTTANAGMETVNPNDGGILPVNVGWKINKSLGEIANDLQDPGKTIEIGMTTAQASGSSMTVHVDAQAGFKIGSWLSFSTSAGMTYDMSQASGTSTDCSVSIKYEGYSMIPAAPAPWQQATNQGFYYADPVAQAVDNEGQDITGFHFLNKPPYDMSAFADGGNFGLLTNILIGNYPTITITYKNANYSSFKESWSETVSGNLTLFGFIKLGSFSQGAYGSSYAEGSDNSTFTVTFSASPEVVGVPQLQKTAYVIGGAVQNPGVKA